MFQKILQFLTCDKIRCSTVIQGSFSGEFQTIKINSSRALVQLLMATLIENHPNDDYASLTGSRASFSTNNNYKIASGTVLDIFLNIFLYFQLSKNYKKWFESNNLKFYFIDYFDIFFCSLIRIIMNQANKSTETHSQTVKSKSQHEFKDKKSFYYL